MDEDDLRTMLGNEVPDLEERLMRAEDRIELLEALLRLLADLAPEPARSKAKAALADAGEYLRLPVYDPTTDAGH